MAPALLLATAATVAYAQTHPRPRGQQANHTTNTVARLALAKG